MGALIGAIHLTAKQKDCLNIEDDANYEKYNICDPDYDKLQLQTYKVNNLDTYRYKVEGIGGIDIIKCPLCKYCLSPAEEEVLSNYIYRSNESEIIRIIRNYHALVKDVYKVKIFEELASKYFQILELMRIVDQTRYYKHICNRSNFKEIIIDICSYKTGFNYETLIYQPYSYEKWGNNETYKTKLLNDRQIAYDEQIRIDELNRIYEEKRARRDQIEERYQEDFDEICIEKEGNLIREIKRNLDDLVQKHKDLYQKEKERFDNDKREHDRHIQEMREHQIDINDTMNWDEEWKRREQAIELDLPLIWKKIIEDIKYYASKKEIKDYMDRYHSYRFEENFYREDWEIEEYHDYIRSQTSEYDRVLHYLRTHDYPLTNKYQLIF